jgi:hypothetical protein
MPVSSKQELTKPGQKLARLRQEPTKLQLKRRVKMLVSLRQVLMRQVLMRQESKLARLKHEMMPASSKQELTKPGEKLECLRQELTKLESMKLAQKLAQRQGEKKLVLKMQAQMLARLKLQPKPARKQEQMKRVLKWQERLTQEPKQGSKQEPKQEPKRDSKQEPTQEPKQDSMQDSTAYYNNSKAKSLPVSSYRNNRLVLVHKQYFDNHPYH